MLRSKLSSILREVPYMLNKNTVPPPQTIFLVINSVCNLRCRMCDIGMNQKDTQFYRNMDTQSTMSIDMIKKLVEEVKQYKPLIAIISTEPLLHPNIVEIVRIIREAGLQCQLTTNGFLLPRFAEALVDADLNTLYVSIDGPENVHDNIRRRDGAWKEAFVGMHRVREHKENTGKKNPYVRINYTISSYNYDVLTKFLSSVFVGEDGDPMEASDLYGHVDFSHTNFIRQSQAAAHNILYGDILPSTPSSVGDTTVVEFVNTDFLWDQIQEVKREYNPRFYSFVPDLKSKEDVEIFYKTFSFIHPWNKCKVPWKAAQILANGDVNVSTRCFNVSFGNIGNTPFMDIWNGEKIQKFRKGLKEVGAYPACSRCCGVF